MIALVAGGGAAAAGEMRSQPAAGRVRFVGCRLIAPASLVRLFGTRKTAAAHAANISTKKRSIFEYGMMPPMRLLHCPPRS
jgi:hypothetical protein